MSIDLHSHLGSSVKPSVLWDLAIEKGMPAFNTYEQFCESLNVSSELEHDDYLKLYEYVHKIQSGPNAVEKCVYTAIATAYRTNHLKYFELRFNPMFRNENKRYDLDQIFMSALTGKMKAEIAYKDITSKLIVEFDKGFTEQQISLLFNKILKYKNIGIHGIDVSGGGSVLKNQRLFDVLYSMAKKSNIKRTFHTGELKDSLNEMEFVVVAIAPERIGHGIQCYRSPELMKWVKKQNIHLELCPISNMSTKCINSAETMKKAIQTLYENGISFSFNSDGFVFLKSSIKSQNDYLRTIINIDQSIIDYAEQEAYKHKF